MARFIEDNIVEMIAPPASAETPLWFLKLSGEFGNPNTHVLIRGPQGCGKSTKVMAKMPAIYDDNPGVIFFSSPSIKQAEEKNFRRVVRTSRANSASATPGRLK